MEEVKEQNNISGVSDASQISKSVQENSMPPKNTSPNFTPIVIIVIVLVLILGGIFILKKIKPGGPRPRPRPSGVVEPSGRPTPQGDVCTSGESVSCSELAGSWGGGKATCRSDGSGYDVSDCQLKSAGRSEMVKPAERDSSQWDAALCNDGTPFGFEVQLSTAKSSDWVIYLQGGGFCDDDIISCTDRSKELRSSPDGNDTALGSWSQEGILSTSSNTNPTFASANHVFAHYCSSDGWSGVTTSKHKNSAAAGGWYFSGRINVASMVEVLKQRYGLDDASKQTKILLTGGSAGGAGAMANADNLATLLAETAKRGDLKILNDAGHIPDFDDSQYRPGDSNQAVRTAIVKATSFWGAKLNPLCEKAHAGSPGECFFTDVVHSYISDPSPKGLGLPFMLQASSIDSFVMGLHGIEDATRDSEAIEEYREKALDSFAGIDWVFSNGEKAYHMTIHKDGPQGFGMSSPKGTLQEVITRFWEGKSPERVIFGNP